MSCCSHQKSAGSSWKCSPLEQGTLILFLRLTHERANEALDKHSATFVTSCRSFTNHHLHHNCSAMLQGEKKLFHAPSLSWLVHRSQHLIAPHSSLHDMYRLRNPLLLLNQCFLYPLPEVIPYIFLYNSQQQRYSSHSVWLCYCRCIGK